MTTGRCAAPSLNTNLSDAPPFQPQRSPLSTSSLIAATIVYGTVLFNVTLSFVNANVTPLTSTPVVACEALLDGSALLCCFTVRSPLRIWWVGLMVFLGAVNIVGVLGNEHLDPKFVRDVLIIPIYAYLGLCVCRNDLIKIMLPLQAIVLAGTLFEAASAEQFGRLLKITSYYINTRGFEQSRFWSTENTDLFVSATRPGERFLFSFLNLHRLSSVFLEPVSLGNYVVIISMMVVTLWHRLGFGEKVFFVTSSFIILVGSDGRFAVVSILAIIVLRIVAPLMPRYSNVFYLPIVVGGGAMAVEALHLSPVGDDFPSRTAGSVEALSAMTPAALFGFDAAHAYSVMDSGIAYLVYSQSVVGAIAVWAFIALGLPQRDRESIAFAHMASFYFATNLLISYSVFSIKTAGVLWFMLGAMGRDRAIAASKSASVPLRAPRPLTLASATSSRIALDNGAPTSADEWKSAFH